MGLNEKTSLRVVLRARRSDAVAADPRAPFSLRDLFLAHVSLPPGATISAYIAQGDEMDPAPLLAVLAANGHPLCLPCVTERGRPLSFRAYVQGDSLTSGFAHIPEPSPHQPLCEPDVVLTPLVGFDKTGQRLGQGGGYYDRTLAGLRARKKILAIGLAYDVQEAEEIPSSKQDARLDAIVTEKRFIDPAS